MAVRTQGHRTQREPPNLTEHHAGEEQRSTARGQEPPWFQAAAKHQEHQHAPRAPPCTCRRPDPKCHSTNQRWGRSKTGRSIPTSHHQQHSPPPASTTPASTSHQHHLPKPNHHGPDPPGSSQASEAPPMHLKLHQLGHGQDARSEGPRSDQIGRASCRERVSQLV